MNKKIKFFTIAIVTLLLSSCSCSNSGKSKSSSTSTVDSSSTSLSESSSSEISSEQESSSEEISEETSEESSSVHEHTFSDEWSYDETKHWHASTCGHDVISDEGLHTFGEWKETTAPQSEKDGEATRTCSVCGYAEYRSIPKTGTLEKLEFLKYGTDDFYRVRAINKNIEGRVVIPEIHNGLPVKELYFNEETHQGAFEDCSKIEYVYIPETITYLNKCAFFKCTGLKDVSLPDTLETIGGDAFYKCESLEEIKIPETVTTIDYSAFENCEKLSSIKLPNGLTYLGSSVFDDCLALTSIVIPDQITVIEESLFEDCTNLKTVVLPKNLTHIHDYAFYGCHTLEGFTLPSSLEYIGNYAFDDCPSFVLNEYEDLKYIGKGDNPYYALVKEKDGTKTTYTINENCEYILEDAFYNCDNLESIVVPKNVKSIKGGAFRCYELTSFALENGSKLEELGDDVFDDMYEKLVGQEINNGYYLGSEENPCMILKTVKDKTGESFTIDENCKFIYQKAFEWFGSLTSITIPDSVLSIGYGAFQNCSGLTSITYGKGVTVIKPYTFESCTGFTSFVIPEGIKRLEGQAFKYCGNLTSVTLPKSIETISFYVFDYCDSLEEINYAGTVEELNALDIPEPGYWGDDIIAEVVHCSDGDVSIAAA